MVWRSVLYRYIFPNWFRILWICKTILMKRRFANVCCRHLLYIMFDAAVNHFCHGRFSLDEQTNSVLFILLVLIIPKSNEFSIKFKNYEKKCLIQLLTDWLTAVKNRSLKRMKKKHFDELNQKPRQPSAHVINFCEVSGVCVCHISYLHRARAWNGFGDDCFENKNEKKKT